MPGAAAKARRLGIVVELAKGRDAALQRVAIRTGGVFEPREVAEILIEVWFGGEQQLGRYLPHASAQRPAALPSRVFCCASPHLSHPPSLGSSFRITVNLPR